MYSNFPVRKVMRKRNAYRRRTSGEVFGLFPEHMRQYLSSRPQFDAKRGRQTLYPCSKNLALGFFFFFNFSIRIKEENIFEFHVFR